MNCQIHPQSNCIGGEDGHRERDHAIQKEVAALLHALRQRNRSSPRYAVSACRSPNILLPAYSRNSSTTTTPTTTTTTTTAIRPPGSIQHRGAWNNSCPIPVGNRRNESRKNADLGGPADRGAGAALIMSPLTDLSVWHEHLKAASLAPWCVARPNPSQKAPRVPEEGRHQR